MTPQEHAHLQVLTIVTTQPEINQRQLAARLGVSLGKANYLLKALLEKGLVKVDNFRRNDNKLGYLYLLTPEGAAAKLRLTRAYLARKEAEYAALRHEIAAMRDELAQQEAGHLPRGNPALPRGSHQPLPPPPHPLTLPFKP